MAEGIGNAEKLAETLSSKHLTNGQKAARFGSDKPPMSP